MNWKYLNLTVAALAIAMVSGSALVANAGETVLCSGRSGGGYDGIMQTIKVELEKRDHTISILNLGGSEDILRNIDAGKCAFGPAQKDIHYLMNVKGSLPNISPVALLYNETMTMACSRESGYDELEDIQKGDKIIVDVIGSGSSLTWETIVQIEKEYGNGSSWAEATPVYSPLDEAGASMSLGEAKCAFGVGKVPISWAKSLEEQGHVISWIYDKDINDLEYNGSALYNPVRVPRGAYNTKFDTYNIPAVLFKSSKFKDEEIESLIKRMAPSLAKK